MAGRVSTDYIESHRKGFWQLTSTGIAAIAKPPPKFAMAAGPSTAATATTP